MCCMLKSNMKTEWEWAGDEAKDAVNYYSQTFCSCVSYTTAFEGEMRQTAAPQQSL